MSSGDVSTVIATVPRVYEDFSVSRKESDDVSYFVSVVVPVFNEEQCIESCFRRLKSLFDLQRCQYELIFVNDGSSDRSIEILLEFKRAYPDNVRVIDLSRNFGHQVAITAGIDNARGEAVVIIDADLQDPPEVIPELIAKWQEGYDVVHARRSERLGESQFKKSTADVYYKLLANISEVALPVNVGDFKLISSKVAKDLRSLRERNRYVRGLVAWVGYKQAYVDYVRQEREAGWTKYSLRKMLRLSMHGIASFSLLPLRVASMCGFAASIGAAIYLLYAIYANVALHSVVAGWTSVIVTVLFIGGLQLICLGIMGEYIGLLWIEAKGRPLYLTRDIY